MNPLDLFDLRFADTARLWWLTGVALLAVAYVALQQRRGAYALRFSDAALLDTVAPRRPGWRRHLVAVLFLGTGSLMIVALAGPIDREIPERATIVLTIDTSFSMGADDVDPSRIDAAKAAAVRFLTEAPSSIDIGVLSFDEVPIVHVEPTADRASAIAAVQGLELGPFTATGDAIIAAVDVVERLGRPTRDDDGEPTALVVLLSDGEPTVGRTLPEAITEANEADVAVSTVALGTPFGEVTIEDPENPGSFMTESVPVREDRLQEIALGTGGEFFSTDSIDELADVYSGIGTTLGEEPVDRDVTDWFVGAALVLAALTASLSLLWFQRLP